MNLQIEDFPVIRLLFCFVVALSLMSCSSPETLEVRQFHLRSTKPTDGNAYIRAEMASYLHGAVSLEERQNRLGQYYTVRWRDLSGHKTVKIVFEYRQVIGASRSKKLTSISSGAEGEVQFEMIGEEYRKKGRILAWRVTLFDGDDAVAQKQSYLWD